MKRAPLFVILSGLYAAHAATRYYQFVRQLKPWSEARQFCKDNYIGLAAVHNQDQNEKLRRLLSKAKAANAWIGLFDNLSLWKWSLNGASFQNGKSFESWKPGNPTRTTDNSSCVTVAQDGYWSDARCTLAFPSVCYNETGPTKYILVNNTLTFYRAKLHCKALNSGLASIRNKAEQDIIAGLVTSTAWIGLNRRRFTRWSNNQVVKYTNWNETQLDIPNTIKQRCSLVSASSGKWFEEDCSKKQYFVCEKRPRVHKKKLKVKFQSSVDMNDPAVIQQIREQIHAKLKNLTSRVRVNWVAANGQVFHKEKKDEWEQSERFEC